MSLVDAFLDSPLAARLGWVFLHFLWQGALIAAALLFVTHALGQRRARERYVASCVALALMLAAPIVTFFCVSAPDPEVSLTVLLAAMERGLLTTPAETTTDWRAVLPALTVFWLLGALVQQARLLLQWWSAQRLKHSFHLPMPLEWQEYVANLRRRLGIRVPVRVVESAVAEVPTVVGWLSPIVLVPTSALLQLSPDQLRMVLAHELAHIRRHDYLVNLVQTAVESLLFFHPAVWWISHRLRVEREYCCDDVAVALHGDALVYARALERLETLRAPSARSKGEPLPLALASNGGSLMQRIQRLVRPASTARKSATLGFVPIALLLAGALSSTAFGFAGNGPASAQDEKEMSDAELERRIVELRRQIEKLEGRLQDLKTERKGSVRGEVRFGPPDAPQGSREFEVHVKPHAEHETHVEPHAEHELHVEPRRRKFELDLGDGNERTIVIEIPEIRIPRIERFGPDGRRFEVRIPDVRFGPGQEDEGGRFEIRIPEIRVPEIELDELQGRFDVHLEDLEHHFEDLEGRLKGFDFHFGDGEKGNVFFFGGDEELDPDELHRKFQGLHEKLQGKLHRFRTDVDVEEIQGHLRETLKDLRIPDLSDLKELEHFFTFELEDFDAGELHREIQESLKGLREKGVKGSTRGMRFMIEIDPDAPEGKARGYRWESKDGEEPKVWIWRSEGEDGPSGSAEDAGLDGKRADGAKDA